MTTKATSRRARISPRLENIKEFTKLYKINIPEHKQWFYYYDLLRKSDEFEHLSYFNNQFSDMEEQHPSVTQYKFKKMDELIDYIKGTDAHALLQAQDVEKFAPERNTAYTSQPEDNRRKDQIKATAGNNNLVYSIDISNANYAIHNYFDQEEELCGSWRGLCDKFDLHEALIQSKSFRQVVFGNCNAKRQEKLQHRVIMTVIELLRYKLGYTEDDIVWISHDELQIKCGQLDQLDDKLYGKLDQLQHFTDQFLRSELNFNRDVFEFSGNLYTLSQIEKGRYIKQNFEIDSLGSTIQIEPTFKTLVGVPGNQFYLYFKKHILEKPIDDRDLYFYNDKRLAKWVIDQ